MKNYKERIKKASEAVNNAEYILIGAGAGLSDAAGINFSGKRFTDRFSDFIEKYDIDGKKVVFMELGVGFNTPGIIRYPFERMTYQNPNATLIRLNKDYPDGVSENKFKTIAFDEDMMEVISAL